MKFYFATTNPRKLKEAEDAAQQFEDIEVERYEMEIDEIQSDSAERVALDKARKAFQEIGKPTVVTDTHWNIPALNGFPGAYMKEVQWWFSVQDWLNLMSSHKDRTVYFSENIAFCDGKTEKFIGKDFPGVILENPRGNDGNGIEKLAEFEGKTLAESHDGGGTSHKPEDYVWFDFFKWYNNQ